MNLCALFVKLARRQLGEAAASICHESQLNAKREVSEGLEIVVMGWYDTFALFAAVRKEHCIIAGQDNHRDAITELRQDLLDETCIGQVETDINGGKWPVTRWKIPRFGEFPLCNWIRKLHSLGFLLRHCLKAWNRFVEDNLRQFIFEEDCFLWCKRRRIVERCNRHVDRVRIFGVFEKQMSAATPGK